MIASEVTLLAAAGLADQADASRPASTAKLTPVDGA